MTNLTFTLVHSCLVSVSSLFRDSSPDVCQSFHSSKVWNDGLFEHLPPSILYSTLAFSISSTLNTFFVFASYNDRTSLKWQRESDMKESSKVIMGATVVMVVSLAIVLGLVLVLLAELYCSLLLRRRLLKPTKTALTGRPVLTTTAGANELPPSSTRSPLTSFNIKGGGILRSPTSSYVLSPKREEIIGQDDNVTLTTDLEAQRGKLGQLLSLQRTSCSTGVDSLLCDGVGALPPHQTSLNNEVVAAAAELVQEEENVSTSSMYYISNPIYDNDVTKERRQRQLTQPGGAHEEEDEETPPFETPDSSPSQLEETIEEYGDEMEARRTMPRCLLKEIQAKAIYVASRRQMCAGTDSENDASHSITTYSSGHPTTKQLAGGGMILDSIHGWDEC